MDAILALSLLALLTAAEGAAVPITTPPHTSPHKTPDKIEIQNFSFFYESLTHKLLVSHGHICYVVTLTDDQVSKIHTNAGLRQVELQFLATYTFTRWTEVDKSTLPRSHNHCGHGVQHWYVDTV